ncbi:hypothetical protein B0H14DRAFT_3150801 [Mycena olivaceomarginata]|nr:hypothetical protein B0H14DRAFT_3150801 [Mycena olivaceomarginata]
MLESACPGIFWLAVVCAGTGLRAHGLCRGRAADRQGVGGAASVAAADPYNAMQCSEMGIWIKRDSERVHDKTGLRREAKRGRPHKASEVGELEALHQPGSARTSPMKQMSVVPTCVWHKRGRWVRSAWLLVRLPTHGTSSHQNKGRQEKRHDRRRYARPDPQNHNTEPSGTPWLTVYCPVLGTHAGSAPDLRARDVAQKSLTRCEQYA